MITASILNDIWCVITNVHKYVIYAIYSALNAVSSAVEALAQGGIDLLPEMPEATDFSQIALPGGAEIGTVLGWVNYVINVPVVIETMLWVYAGLILIWLVRIVLRIAKAES